MGRELLAPRTETGTPLGQRAGIGSQQGPEWRGLEPPTPPEGNSPADGHGQGGLRWGLLEQLLELEQLLLLELLLLQLLQLLLLLVEHGG